MAITVFYSWQSDTAAKMNRNFIEDALKKAIKALGRDLEIQEALRDEEIRLDKDTKRCARHSADSRCYLRKDFEMRSIRS